MKDEHDKYTVDLEQIERVEAVPGTGTPPPAKAAKPPRPKRLANQSSHRPLPGAKPELEGFPLDFGRSVLSVSAAAKDWGVSTRRIRTMLSTGRLVGRRHENGYWEVCYPYFYSEGTRGPCLKRQQRQPDKPKKPEFAEHSPEW